MPKRTGIASWQRAFTRAFGKAAQAASRNAANAVVKALKNAPSPKKKGNASKRAALAGGDWVSGVALGAAGARRYCLYRPPDTGVNERLPLIVMLHGCGQNAEAFALSTRMNRLAASSRFIVLYPEQERTSNAQNCWRWFDTRSGRAQREADSIEAAIRQASLLYPIDHDCVALAGLSAGASMATLMAARHPERYRAVMMHSGIAPGVAHSSSTAVLAMRGRKLAATPLQKGVPLPPLLVIHGSHDHVVAPGNGILAVQLWANQCDARSGTPRRIQRGQRYPMTVTDYRAHGRITATLCEVHGLGHAWSGGAAGQAYSDERGPNASNMIWAFAKKQFASRS